ncbi:MAG TPA: phospholipase D-like domain-containing protein [Deltaproteobacteria bacterium]|nr:phospholipase D-like domain-containing protein [Deltaproteobacteria bacterium]
MKKSNDHRLFPQTDPYVRLIAEQSFSRAAGAPHVEGNSVRLLKDAKENYPAWLEAMRSAGRSIHFENYIIYDDEIGRQFAEVMVERAAAGVKVRVIYDWLGTFGAASRRYWKRLRDAGVEVRCFNPPRLDRPFGWVNRDHRKMIAVDGTIGFVTGLCVGRMWEGYPERSIDPWRDTGIMITGPAVADIEHAFADIWSTMGPGLPQEEIPERSSIHPTGDVPLRVVASAPYTTGLFRLDQLISSVARETLWLTDAYFIGVSPYIQSLAAAAQDGVDVRLLVPGTTDIPFLRSISRAGYQPLLEAGVRIFEWNGQMLHAKTAVVDGKWARIGSTNLNISSWLSNYELDVAIEDQSFAREMEEMYLEDLSHSTEIVLGKRRKACPVNRPARPRHHLPRRSKGSISRAGVGVMRMGSVVGAAITHRRTLEPAEAKLMFSAGAILLALAVLFVLWPQWLAVPFVIIFFWLAAALLFRGFRLVLDHRRGGRAAGKNKET